MADDEKFEMMHNLGEKVVELEKKFNIREQKINELFDLIEKLECKVAENREYSIQFKELYDKELSELKSTKKIDSEIHIILEKRIEELKERVEGIYKSIHGIAPDQPDIIKEVLQGFLALASIPKDFQNKEEFLSYYRIGFKGLLDKLNGGEKTVLKSGDKDSDLPKSVKLTDTDSKPQFICNKCGSKVYLPGVGELKGKYMCANCNNWQEKEKPPKTWADYGFKKDHQEVTDITEKPPEQDFPPLTTKDTKTTVSITYDFDKFKIVEKADLEWLFDNLKLNSPKQKWNELIEKYLTEETEKE